jgi:hypothetical protein
MNLYAVQSESILPSASHPLEYLQKLDHYPNSDKRVTFPAAGAVNRIITHLIDKVNVRSIGYGFVNFDTATSSVPSCAGH